MVIKELKRKFLFNFLKNTDSRKIVKIGESKVIPAFKYASENVPAYKQILLENNVGGVESIEDFKKLPILTKNIFNFDIEDLCVNGLDNMGSAMTSSGFSNTFSYGVITNDSEKKQKGMTDALIDYFLQPENEKVLIINAMSMGFTLSSSYPIFNTGVRSDMVIALIKKFQDKFDYILIIADPHFAKKIVEEGIKSGVNWKSICVSFVLVSCVL